MMYVFQVYVGISFPLTYSHDAPVQVGDLVKAPFGASSERVGEVVELGSAGYSGPIKPIISVVPKDRYTLVVEGESLYLAKNLHGLRAENYATITSEGTLKWNGHRGLFRPDGQFFEVV